ncbi:MAG: metallophosphoesterase [Clostridia bacterium]|nr:metallophosphoesterase [Clostridia bacterium]
MKKFCFLLILMLLIGMCSACGKESVTTTPAATEAETTPAKTVATTPVTTVITTPVTTPETTPDTDADDGELRVIISSDIHCTNLQEWYNVRFRTRIQHWVDTILAEHAENPIDLLIINGDISLDYWISGGSVVKYGKDRATSQIFINEYLSQLPDEIPVFIIPGNHEQYSNEDWLALTGNNRQGYMFVGGRLFICLDTFGGELDPDYHHDGVYTGVDMDYVKGLLETYPDCDVYLVAHHFDTAKESAAFRKLVKENDRIKGLFSGHTHKTAIIELGAAWGNKTIAQTGNFAYFKDSAKESFWGFRELVISDTDAYSQYIIAKSKATVDGTRLETERTIRAQVTYYGTAPELPKEPERPDPLLNYNTLYDKIDQATVDGDEGMKESNRVQLALDNDITTKWCVSPTASDKSVTMTWSMTEAVRVEAYAISTANDALDRNPDAWTLYARNSEDEEWVAISVVTKGNLPKELRTVSDVFVIENPAAYQHYKLTVTKNFNSGSLYQFSELILLQNK